MRLNRGWSYHSQVGADAAAADGAGAPGGALSPFVAEYVGGADRAAARSSCRDAPPVAGDLLQAGDVVVWHRPPWQEPEVPRDFDVLHEDDRRRRRGQAERAADHAGRRLPRTHAAARSCANGSVTSVRCTGSAASRRGWCCLRARRGPRRPWRWPGGLTRCRRTIGRWSTARRSGIGSRCASRSARCRIRGWAPSTPPAPMAARRSAGSPWSNAAPAPRCSTVGITTGRPHQIRIHCACAGHPLQGDPLYVAGGQPRADDPGLPGDGGYLLHAWRLRCAHPSGDGDLQVEAPLPPGLRRAAED